MRTKTANEIRKILKYLVSPDEELMNLGVGLFQDCYLLTQLPKNKIFEVEYRWPGFSSNTPPHFKEVPRYGKILKFTKGQFIKMLNSKTTTICKKAVLILSFVYDKVGYSHSIKNRNSNYTLKSAISYYKNLNNTLVAQKAKLEGKAYYRSYFDRENKQITSQIQNFQDEINAFDFSLSELGFNRCDRVTPKEVINYYKNYLHNNYKNKHRIKWFRNNYAYLSDKFHISFNDLKLFERTGLCTSTFFDVLHNKNLI